MVSGCSRVDTSSNVLIRMRADVDGIGLHETLSRVGWRGCQRERSGVQNMATTATIREEAAAVGSHGAGKGMTYEVPGESYCAHCP